MRIARVVVEVAPFHLDRLFDYVVPDDMAAEIGVGSRVEVLFGGRRRRGLVAAMAASSALPGDRLQPIRRVLGDFGWVTAEELDVMRWAAWRFGGTLADVIRHALPARTVAVERQAAKEGWFPPGRAGRPAPPTRQVEVPAGWRRYAQGEQLVSAATSGSGAFFWRPLPGEDVGARLVELLEATLAGGRDALVVVPEPSSAVADALVAAAGDLAVDARGGPSERRSYRLWLRARCGVARVIVGERGVALWPLERLGLALVLDEANPALKERRSPRHHAREMALERSRRAGAVGLLVGTLPSATAWRLLRERRLLPVTPERRAERRAAPLVQVAADRGARTRLSRDAMDTLRRATAAGAYGVVLAARRGEGSALACRDCRERLACPTCSSSLSRAAAGVRCVTCGWTAHAARCRNCRSDRLVPLAAGAQRLGDELRQALDVPVAALEGYDQPAPPPPAVLVMTRGSVVDTPPGPVAGVVLPDLDGLLRRPGLDAAEDTLRLAFKLAAWTVVRPREPDHAASRRRDASVVGQTREPDHPAIRALVGWDPGAFWRAEAKLRAELRFPPAAYALRLQVDVADGAAGVTDVLRAALPAGDDLLGPVCDDGSATFLIRSDDRDASLQALKAPRERWSREGLVVRLDVDPVG